ncbi:MAG TPA: hypothetical protein VGM91_19005 [Conexibacter sp.]|jgi:hypothetical protein
MAKQQDGKRRRERPTTAAGRRGRGGRANGPVLPSVANHPRAGDQVKRAKAYGGLTGFLLVTLVSWQAGVPAEDLLLRALAGGIVTYLVVWACAVALWRHLVVTELQVVREQRAEEMAERAERLAALRAARGEGKGTGRPGA